MKKNNEESILTEEKHGKKYIYKVNKKGKKISAEEKEQIENYIKERVQSHYLENKKRIKNVNEGSEKYDSTFSVSVLNVMYDGEFRKKYDCKNDEIKKIIRETAQNTIEELIKEITENRIESSYIYYKKRGKIRDFFELFGGAKFGFIGVNPELKKVMDKTMKEYYQEKLKQHGGNINLIRNSVEEKIDEIEMTKEFIKEINTKMEEKPIDHEEYVNIKNRIKADFSDEGTRKMKSEFEKLSQEDKAFYEQVKDFTNNFEFLTEVTSIRNQIYGRRGMSPKFKTVEDFFKFYEIQNKVSNHMEFYGKKEEAAINEIIKTDKDMSPVSKLILNERVRVIKKQKELER